MKVVNVGSLNVDRTYRVHSFVSAGETIKALAYEEHCGGKGLNQSVAIARADAEVWHVGAIGRDGRGLVDLLRKAGVRCDFIEEVDGPTGHAVIQVEQGGQNCIIICGGANDGLSRNLIDCALATCTDQDIVLVQNETANVGYTIAAAKARGLTVVCNPSPLTKGLLEADLSGVSLFILNEFEASALAGVGSQCKQEKLLRCLTLRYPSAAFLVTFGSDGCCYYDSGRYLSCPAFSVPVVDTTGAGDTFCGYFLAGILRGTPVEAAMEKASAAAALSVMGQGASESIPALAAVNAFLERELGSEREGRTQVSVLV